MNGLEKLGLLKMDFLGLTTLTLIDDAVNLIEKRHGVKLVHRGSAARRCRRPTKSSARVSPAASSSSNRRACATFCGAISPSRIEDLTALNALYRPGPIQGGMLDDFIERKHGRKEIPYDLPELKEVLEETYGVILYQEQVMQISNRLAGYSLGDADLLRRAMGKKKAEEMAQAARTLRRGRASTQGHPQKKVEKIFDLMEQFAGYGFNKSHSAAYAYLAFVTAYFKAHYPVDFMAALLTSETGNVAKVVKYINECREWAFRCCRRMSTSAIGIYSRWRCDPLWTGRDQELGRKARRGDYQGAQRESVSLSRIYQFCENADHGRVNKRVIESLLRPGRWTRFRVRAADDAGARWAIEAGQHAGRDKASGQGGLFGGMMESHPEPELPKAHEWTLAREIAGRKGTARLLCFRASAG